MSPTPKEVAQALRDLSVFLRILRGSSDVILTGYRIEVARNEYEKAVEGYKVLQEYLR